MSHLLYGRGTHRAQSLVHFFEMMQTYEAKCKHFLLYFQITNSELKGEVEIYLEKTVNFTFVRISLPMNNILSH